MREPLPLEDPLLCRQCRGLCCQGAPGLWADPDRFFRLFFPQGPPPAGKLPRLLEQKGLTLHTVLGVPIPAPRRTGHGCIFLTAQGCRLPREWRPCQCLGLQPSLDTLLTGAIDCHLPAELHGNRVASRWQSWWQRQPEFIFPDSSHES